jgi:hypothetical protein
LNLFEFVEVMSGRNGYQKQSSAKARAGSSRGGSSRGTSSSDGGWKTKNSGGGARGSKGRSTPKQNQLSTEPGPGNEGGIIQPDFGGSEPDDDDDLTLQEGESGPVDDQEYEPLGEEEDEEEDKEEEEEEEVPKKEVSLETRFKKAMTVEGGAAWAGCGPGVKAEDLAPILWNKILKEEPMPQVSATHTTLHYTTLHYTTLHCTALHCSTLHYTILHHTILHYTTLSMHYRATGSQRRREMRSRSLQECARKQPREPRRKQT